MEKKIEDMLVEELKIVGFEQFILLEQKKNEVQIITTNINLIQAELLKRTEAKKVA